MLLWALISAGYTALFAVTMSDRIPENFYRKTLGVLGLISLALALFLTVLSNPFARVLGDIPINGNGLNPLLQDVGLAIHPPILYLGYVGLVIPYALGIAGLLARTEEKLWASVVKPWTYIALAFLTTGIILGSWWAYRELGWGGWWFWDPVENASLLPWLVGIALAHSVMALSARGGLANWSFALAILAFGMSVLGTFLVRSGNLVSVHAFAANPGRGIAILSFFALLVGGGLILIAQRSRNIIGPDYNLFSRDGALLGHNLLVIAVAITILLGTAYPPIIQALKQPPLAVGAPFYHATVIPIMIIALVFMAIGPEIPWRQAKAKVLFKHSLIALIPALAVSIVTILIFRASLMGAFATGASILLIGLAMRMIKRSTIAKGRSRLPMGIAHLAAGIFALAATLSNVFAVEADRALTPGESFAVQGYTVTLKTLREAKGPNYIYVTANISVQKEGGAPVSLRPQYRFYPARNFPTTEADIRTSLFKDLRASLNAVEGDQSNVGLWAVRFHMRPAMIWLWLSTLLGAFGLFLAARNALHALPARGDV